MDQLNQHKRESQGLSEENVSLKRQVDRLHREKEDLLSVVDRKSTESNLISEQRKSTEEMIVSLQRGKLELQNRLADIEGTEINSKFEIIRLSKENENLNKMNQFLTQELDAKTEQLTTYRREKGAECIDLRAQLEGFTSEMSKMNSQIQLLKEDLQDSQTQLTAERVNLKELREKLAAQSEQFNQELSSRAKLNDLQEATIKRYQDQMLGTNAEMEEMKERYQNLIHMKDEELGQVR